jgi:hypothetical protein
LFCLLVFYLLSFAAGIRVAKFGQTGHDDDTKKCCFSSVGVGADFSLSADFAIFLKPAYKLGCFANFSHSRYQDSIQRDMSSYYTLLDSRTRL